MWFVWNWQHWRTDKTQKKYIRIFADNYAGAKILSIHQHALHCSCYTQQRHRIRPSLKQSANNKSTERRVSLNTLNCSAIFMKIVSCRFSRATVQNCRSNISMSIDLKNGTIANIRQHKGGDTTKFLLLVNISIKRPRQPQLQPAMNYFSAQRHQILNRLLIVTLSTKMTRNCTKNPKG